MIGSKISIKGEHPMTVEHKKDVQGNTYFIQIPEGKLAAVHDDGAASERRRLLKEALTSGKNVAVSGGQIVTSADSQPGSGALGAQQNTDRIPIPAGKLAAVHDDGAASERRRLLKEALTSGKNVAVSGGQIVTSADSQPGSGALGAQQNTDRIPIPAGKLAFYWYEREPELFKDEKEIMARFFPEFKMEILPDKRISWVGSVLRPIAMNNQDRWHLQVIYDNNHPHADSYGGSIKVYTIVPDLNELYQQFGTIPHVLTDRASNLYICTADHTKGDVRADYNTGSDTAAIAIARAIKWITVFELWVEGDVTYESFKAHTY